MKVLKKIKKVLTNDAEYRKSYATGRKKAIKKGTYFIESSHGENLYGHMYQILVALNERMKFDRVEIEKKVFVSVKEPKKWEKYLSERKLYCTFVEHSTKQYGEMLATCEYLYNDTSFYPFFNKRNEQVYTNIWHGTPLKNMGKHDSNPLNMANIQKNIYATDYLVLSNEYSADIFKEAYNLNGVYQGEIIVTSSPRNDVLRDQHLRAKIRKANQLDDKKVIVYMPTWRGQLNSINSDLGKLQQDLEKMNADAVFNNNIIYIKLHPFQEKLLQDMLHIDELDHVFYAPNELDIYEFLSAADVLVTDYSSVMFDFLNTKNKIVLYEYDKTEYYEERGCYEDTANLAFSKAYLIEEVIDAYNSTSLWDYSLEIEKFTSYDSRMPKNSLSANLILDKIEKNIVCENMKIISTKNNKKTLVFFAGGLWFNGITTELLNTLLAIDVEKYNVVVAVNKKSMKKETLQRLYELPQGVLYYPITGGLNANLFDRYLLRRYATTENLNISFLRKKADQLYLNEFNRIFNGLKIDWFIHYTGYERKIAGFVSALKTTSTKTAIWLHSDMIEERKVKGKGLNWKMLLNAYQDATKVVAVTKEIMLKTDHDIPGLNNLVTITNFIGEDRVRKGLEANTFQTLVDAPVDSSYIMDVKSIIKQKMNIMKRSNRVPDKIMNSYLIIEGDRHLHDYFPHIDLESYKTYKEQRAKNNIIINGTVPESIENDFNKTNVLSEFGFSKVKMLNEINQPELKFFVNIGRYSYQKGHDKLLLAFNEVYKCNKKVRLLIIASYGDLKAETINLLKSLSCNEAVYIMGRMDNPYKLLSKCDAFVLSSNYEGLGLVLYEALAVGLDVITVDLSEVTGLMEEGNAIVVENNSIGLENGMKQYLEGNYRKVPFDFEKWKNHSLKQFYKIFD